MISVYADPRRVCRGKRAVRKREDGGRREGEGRREGGREVKKKNNQEQCTGWAQGGGEQMHRAQTEIRQRMAVRRDGEGRGGARSG